MKNVKWVFDIRLSHSRTVDDVLAADIEQTAASRIREFAADLKKQLDFDSVVLINGALKIDGQTCCLCAGGLETRAEE